MTSGLAEYLDRVEAASTGSAFTLHIQLIGQDPLALPREFALFRVTTAGDGILVEELRGDTRSEEMFIPASAIRTIEVEYS